MDKIRVNGRSYSARQVRAVLLAEQKRAMARPPRSLKMLDIKSANDACFHIVKATEEYAEGQFNDLEYKIQLLRTAALRGLKQENKHLKMKLRRLNPLP